MQNRPSMNKALIPMERMVVPPLIACIAALFVLRCFQVFSYSTEDFDTSSILLALHGGFYEDSGSFTNFAHPGLLAFWVTVGNTIKTHWGIFPIHYWGTLLCLAIAAASIMIFKFLRFTGASYSMATIGVALYLSSPAISDISTRSEENLLLHLFLVFSIYAIMQYERKQSALTLCTVMVSATLLALQHTQPYVVMCGGLFLYAVQSRFAPRTGIKSIAETKLFLLFLLPGTTVHVILQYFLAIPQNHETVYYFASTYYTILHNDSMYSYLRAFFLFLQGCLLTGAMPFRYTSDIGILPTSKIYLVGFICLPLLLYCLRKRRLLDLIALSALGFVFLAEAVVTERWDTFVIVMLLAICSSATTDQNSLFERFFPASIAIAIFMLNLMPIKNQYEAAHAAVRARMEVSQLIADRLIYSDLDGASALVRQLPYDFKLKNIVNASPQPGDFIYSFTREATLSNFTYTKMVHGVCQDTNIPGLCLLTSHGDKSAQ